MRNQLALVLISSALLFTGCKKKETKPEAIGSGSAKVEGQSKATEGQPANTPADPNKPADPKSGDLAKPADPASANAPVPGAKDLLETAKANGKFTTLIKAVDAAGLSATLSGAGPFTLLAPTDEAFAKIPQKDLDALLADKAKLEALLQYHVIAGALASKDISGQKTIKTVAGSEVAVDASSGVKIGGATVITPDIAASNGVIHAIDTVLTPPAK